MFFFRTPTILSLRHCPNYFTILVISFFLLFREPKLFFGYTTETEKIFQHFNKHPRFDFEKVRKIPFGRDYIKWRIKGIDTNRHTKILKTIQYNVYKADNINPQMTSLVPMPVPNLNGSYFVSNIVFHIIHSLFVPKHYVIF